jgi:flavodoxin
MNKAETITVNGFFGKKKMTKDEFIEAWLETGSVDQLWRISNYSKEHKAQIKQIEEWISKMAKESFEEVLG